MAERLPLSWWLRLLAEMALWQGLALAFLYLYVGHFDAPTTSIRPHLSLVGTLWLGLACMRLASWKWVPHDRGPRWIVATFSVFSLAVLLLYYMLVLAGLASWGRVISWLLIKSYALQSFDLIRALGYSPAFVITTLAGIFLLSLAGATRWLSPHDWANDIARRAPSVTLATCILLVCGIVALRLFMFIDFSPVLQGEPVSMTLFPNQGAHKAQSHLAGGTRLLDRSEAAERAAYVPNAGAQRRNVILIVGDALRSDHMGVYGYARPTTPYLQALARHQPVEKVGDMTSVCAESACGLLALAVSRYVHDAPQHPMSLQEVLRRHGYEVHMILGGDHTNFYGLREAYGEVDSYFDASTQDLRYLNDDQLVLDRTTALPTNDPAQPVMLQFHLMSSHALGRRHGTSLRYQPSLNYSSWVTFGKAAPTDASELDKAVNFYDNGVVQFDLMVQQLLMLLQQKGYLEDALVVITGDHGEMLGEHGQFGHAKQVYEAGLRVPLMLIRYGYEGAPLATNRLASQVDVAPTILGELHMPKPATWRGFPLQESNEREFIQFQQKALTGVYDLRQPRRIMKYWKDFASGREYVFNITADSREQHNLLDQADTEDLSWWRREVMTSALVVPPQSFDAGP